MEPVNSGGAVRSRIGFLDMARGWAIVGVVLAHSFSAVPGEEQSAPEQDIASTVVTAATNVGFEGVSRALLAMLLGVGLVLAWRSAAERGAAPARLLVRRYAVLFLIGLPHWYVFRPDILTQYALLALALVPLLPWLLRGAAWRPLVLAAACVPLHGVLALLDADLPPYLVLDTVKASSTLLALAVGVWLGRLPELTAVADPMPPADPQRRRARALTGWGLALLAAGGAALAAGFAVFPSDGTALPPPTSTGLIMLLMFGISALCIGRALLYLGPIWWLVQRGRRAARALGWLAPLGRMSLTVYLGSTALFLGYGTVLTTGADIAHIPGAVRFAVGAGYVAVMAVGCRLWLRHFRFGPVEWLWRRLTYLHPLPMRKPRDSVIGAQRSTMTDG